MTLDSTGTSRPATALISYAHEDDVVVKYLQLQLKLRGVRTWLDDPNLTSGSALREEITHNIEQEADAFVMYVTPNYLNSRFIWDVEVRAALERQKRDPLFNIIPIMHRVTLPELQHECAVRSYPSLTYFKAEQLPDTITIDTEKELHEKLRAIAARALKATLALRLRRVQADSNYSPWIRLCTFDNRPSTSTLDLDLDWWDLFRDRERVPSIEEWRDMLFPALLDVKSALGEKHTNHNLHIAMQAILPVAFALGYIFPYTSSFNLLPESKKGTWSTAGTPAASPSLLATPYDESGDRHVAVVEIALSNHTAPASINYLREAKISYGHHIRYDLLGGPDPYDGVKDADHALAIARYIGKELRTLYGQGVTHIHLFAAIPVALAVLLGHQFNALCPISLYHHDSKEYKRACILGSSV